jgi:hypothetical protein
MIETNNEKPFTLLSFLMNKAIKPPITGTSMSNKAIMLN